MRRQIDAFDAFDESAAPPRRRRRQTPFADDEAAQPAVPWHERYHWMMVALIAGVLVAVLAVFRPYQPPRPLVHGPTAIPTLDTTGQGHGQDGATVLAMEQAPAPVTLMHDTLAYWSASATAGPPVQAGTVLRLDARTADGQRLLATSPVWAQPLWISTQDTDVSAAGLFALPVLADPTATPVPTATLPPPPPPPPPPTEIPMVCAWATTADSSLSRQGCGYSLDAALANANAALDAAILAAPPPTSAPRPTDVPPWTNQPVPWFTPTPLTDMPRLDPDGGSQ